MVHLHQSKNNCDIAGEDKAVEIIDQLTPALILHSMVSSLLHLNASILMTVETTVMFWIISLLWHHC